MKKGFIIKIFFIFIITLLFALPLLSTISNAGTPSIIDPGTWEPDALNPSQMDDLTDTASIIIDVIRVVGVVVAVVVLLVLGIKYMIGSTSERAEYKKSMIPYLIGAVIFFALSQILGAIIEVVESINV